MKTKVLGIFFLFVIFTANSQDYPFLNSNGAKIAFKVSGNIYLYSRLKKNEIWYRPSGNISFAFGTWGNYRMIQPASNLSATISMGRWHLGNRPKSKTRLQVNLVITPILTYGFNEKINNYYDEINPFYLGFASGVFSNYKNALSLGSSFVLGPKGRFKNINSPRNRSQQLIFIAIKKSTGTNSNFTINLYEDYFGFTDNAIFESICDNRDRYYTGGGNIQFRLNEKIIFKYYTEAYTGISYPNTTAFPDLVKTDDTIGSKYKLKRWFAGPRRFARYVFQDPGQHLFNTGRNIFLIDFSPNTINNTFFVAPKFQFFIGSQEGKNNMWQQNAIHNAIKINKNTPLNFRLKNNGKTENATDRYHRFLPRETKPRLVLGFGMEGVVK